ncbi:MAG TPA: hypothetical protein VE197_08580, partial [Mycobacterium sp.]|nr:hypothetical protein [Mycobacterium sp.]
TGPTSLMFRMDSGSGSHARGSPTMAPKGSTNMTGQKGHKTESDVETESHETRSRAGTEQEGSYVGRTDPDDALDVGETGAEARSERE